MVLVEVIAESIRKTFPLLQTRVHSLMAGTDFVIESMMAFILGSFFRNCEWTSVRDDVPSRDADTKFVSQGKTRARIH